MIDHVLGRPSVRFRKIQVFAVVAFWSAYLLRGNNHGPPLLRTLSERLSKKITAWQAVVMTLLWLYTARNFAKICGLESPEPLANLYTRAYFRATWFATALDAGFWTAMRIRRKWLRDISSIVFSVYYLFAAEQADEKVRKVRGALTVEHLRISWNKLTTPYISLLAGILRPRLTRYGPRKLRIPRPPHSAYREPISAWLYFDGPLSSISRQTSVVLDIPGGGFVAMDPRSNDDRLLAWAGQTGRPILSLDYRKAPEYPYPYALNECFDAYTTLVSSNGRCIGLTGAVKPRIILTGDSAGGNIATGVCLMVLQARQGLGSQVLSDPDALPAPSGLILMYPALDMNINSWMTDEQMSLIQAQQSRPGNRDILRKKSEDCYRLDPSTPHPSERDEDEDPMRDADTAGPITPTRSRDDQSDDAASSVLDRRTSVTADGKPSRHRTRLAMSSMISYFNDRVLTPEMMRAMIILYVGPYARPDFTTDFLLSPLLAPEALLAAFPRTCFLTGERDPLVDDTVIFAGRLRQAQQQAFLQRQELGLLPPRARFDERARVEVALIPGISHGFLHFAGVFPQAWKHIYRCGRWIDDIFAASDPTTGPNGDEPSVALANGTSQRNKLRGEDLKDQVHSERRSRHHTRTPTDSSGDEEHPLEMTPINGTRMNGTGSMHGSDDSAGLHNTKARQSKSPRNRTGGKGIGSGSGSGSGLGSGSGSGSGSEHDQVTLVNDASPISGTSSPRHHVPKSEKRGSHRAPKPPPVRTTTNQAPREGKAKAGAASSRSDARPASRRQRSDLSLGSQEDLLKRRMKGLAGGLMGISTGEELHTP